MCMRIAQIYLELPRFTWMENMSRLGPGTNFHPSKSADSGTPGIFSICRASVPLYDA